MFNKYPYTDFHELNLDWILRKIRELQATMETFVSIAAIKYADPILWDITAQYEQNTVVIDPQTGDGYLSVRPVPVGVSLSNTQYWTPIFNYQAELDQLEQRLQPQITQNANDIDNLEATDIALSGRLTTAEGDIDALEGRMLTAEGDITALDGRVDTLETSVQGLKWYVTPEDFGATGGEDDSAAVQAAFNDGRPVYFTRNYNIKSSVTIPFDVTRVVTIDFDQYWLNYKGDGTDTAALIMRGNNCILKNIKINNETSHSLIGIYWTSASNVEFSGMNTIYGCQIYNFKTGIFYGDINGVVDAPQSENVLIGFKTRGVELCFYSLMNNAIIHIIGSVLMSSVSESQYSFDVNRAACVRCDSGLVEITGSTLDKVDNTSGFGIFGSGIHVTDSVIECASSIIFASGDITLENIKGGYYSQSAIPPIFVDPAASGMLILNNVINRPSAPTNAKLVSAVSGYNGNNNYKVMISDCKLPNRVYGPTIPISDYPVIVKSSVINGESIDLHTVKFNKNNYNRLTLSQATAAISGNDIVITSGGLYPSVSLPTYDTSGSMQIYCINVTSVTGNWNIVAAQTDASGNVTYSTQALHNGMNVFVVSGYDTVVLNLSGSATTDVLSFDDIQVGLM